MDSRGISSTWPLQFGKKRGKVRWIGNEPSDILIAGLGGGRGCVGVPGAGRQPGRKEGRKEVAAVVAGQFLNANNAGVERELADEKGEAVCK